MSDNNIDFISPLSDKEGSLDTLLQKQASRKLAGVKKLKDIARAKEGWVRYVRQALMMTTTQLAQRLKCSQSTISEFEKREKLETISLKKLRQLAEAMGCDLVYAFAPKTSFEDIIDHAAERKAIKLLSSADTHMTLEDQKVHVSKEERINYLKERFIVKGDIW